MGVPLRLFSAAKKSWCRYFQGTSVSSGKNYFIIAPAIGLKSFKTSIAGRLIKLVWLQLVTFFIEVASR